MDLLHQTFLAAELAAAANVSPATLQNWANRDLIVGHRGGGEKGRRRQFTWFNMMEVATAASLVGLGMTPANSFKAAAHFSHGSSSPQIAKGQRVSAERLPSLPWHFRDGLTYLFAFADQSSIQLVSFHGETNLRAVRQALGGSLAFVALDMTEIFRCLTGAIGQDWRVLLDEAYPESTS
jgi:hypothetical protein